MCRSLRERLELCRGLRPFVKRQVGSVARIKAQLRAMKCPIPSPRRTSARLTKLAIEAARRGETVSIDIDEL